MKDNPSHSPFPSTRWSVVLAVRAAGDERAAQAALARLCADYWYPLYAFARRRGCSAHDAQDRTQGFFADIVEKNLFAEAEPQLGKLRTFLLTAFQRFLRDVHDHDHARKRGGGEVLALDISTGEDCFAREPADPATPEKTFARHWALAVLRAALAALAEEEARAGRTAPFRALEPFLSPDSAAEPDYADAARQLGVSEDAARQSVSRLRKKFRETLRGQIADTLHDPSAEHIAEELASLRAALRG